MRGFAIIAALVATPATAQVVYPPAQVDMSTVATKSEVQAVQAAIPQPDSAVPPMETVNGAAGATNTYRRGDAVQPRITRAGQCTIAGGAGGCAGSWSTAFPNGANVNVIFTPVNAAGAQPIICNLTAAPTVTAYAAKCWTMQNSALAAVTIVGISAAIGGQNVVPAVPAADGTVIQVTGLPKTQ